MIYFAGGANNDQDDWNYMGRFKAIFESEGIQPFERIDFSLGKSRDIWFTSMASSEAWFAQPAGSRRSHTIPDLSEPIYVNTRVRIGDDIALRAARHVHEQSAGIRLMCGGPQLDLMGYSYGSVLMAHVALIMTDNQDIINNLVLVGCPISSSSPLYSALASNGRINRIIRHDIPNDYLRNPDHTGVYLLGAFQNYPETGPHFDLARPDDPETAGVDEGVEADNRIRALARRLYKLETSDNRALARAERLSRP